MRGSRRGGRAVAVAWVALSCLLVACGGGGPAALPAVRATPETVVPTQPPAIAAPQPRHVLTPAELAFFHPNELGVIPILMYHTITEEPGEWNRTPDEFRADLEYLYEEGYFLIPLHQYITGDIDVPAGKTPVVLTFDDSSESQFRYWVRRDGSWYTDPDSAVGILEKMYARHPDFGRAAVFYVLPGLPFGDDDDKNGQRQFADVKLRWLLDHGYEIGSHTVTHPNMGELNNDQIKAELAGAVDMIRQRVPNAPVESIALPFGIYPPGGDTTLLSGFTYQGRNYGHRAALMVGSEPAHSPYDKRCDLMWLPRIRGSEEQLVAWFGDFLQVTPEMRYISDGNPDVVTVPNTLHPDLAGQLDPAKVGQRRIIRYDP